MQTKMLNVLFRIGKGFNENRPFEGTLAEAIECLNDTARLQMGRVYDSAGNLLWVSFC